jgi:hypothetical protein
MSVCMPYGMNSYDYDSLGICHGWQGNIPDYHGSLVEFTRWHENIPILLW